MAELTTLSAKTVGQLVAERPERARVFEQVGIDYCCGGRNCLEDACAKKGVDVQRVLSMLAASDAVPPTNTDPDWRTAPLSQLVQNIESTHHRFMRDELQRTSALIKKVATAHGAHRPALRELEQVFEGFTNDLLSHMYKEEVVLFPWIRAIESQPGQTVSGTDSLDMPIRAMMHDHDDAGNHLKIMRDLMDDYVPPLDACGTYRVMLSALQGIETDLHLHVHKENNILFPRALSLASIHA